jgi:predicted phage terminase large subunit-like protein
VREFSDEDLAFASLAGWCAYIDPFWRAFPHLVLLCRELEDFAIAVARGEERRLAVFLPPQHGKSQVVSRAFTTWLLGRWPHLRVILASYESSYAAQWGRYARDALTEFGPRVFGVSVSQSSSAADHWELARPHQGAFHAAGLAAGITGQPCEVAVIDDPHRNLSEAVKGPIQQKIIDNYKGALLTRQPRGIVLVMTRWTTSDLGEWVSENEKHMNWKIVRLPAFAEENDPLGRAPGLPLCPDLRPAAFLENLRMTMSSFEWSGMFQQRPVPAEGGLFKREHARRYKWRGDSPRERTFHFQDGSASSFDVMRRFLTVDTATSEKQHADFTAVAAWGVTTRGRLVLLDLDLRRIEAPAIVEAITTMAARWDAVPWIEETTQSAHLLSFLRTQGVAFRTVEPRAKDKFTRAIPASALWEQGKLVLPEHAPWLPAYERQLFAFSAVSTTNDDAVDVTAYAGLIYLEEFVRSQTVLAMPHVVRRADPLSGLLTPKPPPMT